MTAAVHYLPSVTDFSDDDLDAIAAWNTQGCDIPPEVEAFMTARGATGVAPRLRKFTPEQRQLAWDDLQAAVLKRDALAAGSRHWCEFYDEAALPPGLGLQDAAIQVACADVDAARWWLKTGTAR